MSRGTGRFSFDDVTSVGGRTRLPWSDDRAASEDPRWQTRARQSDVYAVPQRRAGATSPGDVTSFVPEPELDASDAQRAPSHTYDRASTPAQRTPPATTEQQAAPSFAAEEYPLARPQQLTGVVGLVAAGLGLLAAGVLGHQLMTTTGPAPVPAVAAAQPPAPIVEPVPPPLLMSIAPEPPPAAPPPEAAVRVAAAPVSPPIAAAALQRRAHAAAKRKPPVETTIPAESPATAELDALAVPAETPAAEEPPEEAEPGTLRINSLPWAQVFLDGQLIGNTPLRGVRVPAGEHSLRFVNHQFAMVKTSEIDVPAGEELTIVERLDE